MIPFGKNKIKKMLPSVGNTTYRMCYKGEIPSLPLIKYKTLPCLYPSGSTVPCRWLYFNIDNLQLYTTCLYFNLKCNLQVTYTTSVLKIKIKKEKEKIKRRKGEALIVTCVTRAKDVLWIRAGVDCNALHTLQRSPLTFLIFQFQNH